MSLPKINNITQLTTYLSGLETRLERVECENEILREEINELKMENMQLRESAERALEADEARNRLPSGLPNTGLLSRSFLSRAFTVWGHYFVAQVIIALGIGAAYLVFVMIVLAAVTGSK